MLGAPTRIHSSLWKALPVFSITFGVLVGLAAQAQQNSVEERVNMILGHMTLEEKLAYVSGVGFPNPSPSPIGIFNIKPIERLKLPEIYGVDGSIGFTGQGATPGTDPSPAPDTHEPPSDNESCSAA